MQETMQEIGFDDLARSKAIESCEAAFRGATGFRSGSFRRTRPRDG